MGKEFVKRGYSVTCLTTHANLKSLDERNINISGVNVHFVGQMQILKIGNQKYYFSPLHLLWVVSCSTAKMILKGLCTNTDVLFCFKPQPVHGFAAIILKFLKGVPLIIDTDDYEAGFNRLSFLQKKIVSIFEDKLPKWAHKVTYSTSYLKQRYIDLGYSKDLFITMQYSPDEKIYNRPDPKKVEEISVRHKLQGKHVVLYFGALSIDSGHAVDLLIEAFKYVHQKFNNAVLLVVGGGEDYRLLLKLAKDLPDGVIRFAGRVAPNEIPHYLDCSTISVDPARDTLNNKGRSPWKIFESMVAGIPVVSSNVGDRQEYLGYGTAGIIVKPGDAKALANGIAELLSDYIKLQSMSVECRKIMKQKTWPILVDHLIEKIPALKDS